MPTEPTNVFRPAHRDLTEEDKDLVAKVKDSAFELYKLYLQAEGKPLIGTNARYVALAKTNLEESVMWAVKGITG